MWFSAISWRVLRSAARVSPAGCKSSMRVNASAWCTTKAQAVQEDAQKKAAEEAARQKQKLEEEARNRLKGLFGK